MYETNVTISFAKTTYLALLTYKVEFKLSTLPDDFVENSAYQF